MIRRRKYAQSFCLQDVAEGWKVPFRSSICVDEIILVAGAGEEEYCRKEIVEAEGFRKVKTVVTGGKERYDSVFAGLKAASGCDYVLIHDGARPCVTEEIIRHAAVGAEQYGACVVGMPVKDTIKVADKEGYASHTPCRSLKNAPSL